MPIFEFTCRKCGRQFEEILSLAELESEIQRCPACGAANVERNFSVFATGGGGSASGGSAGGGGGGSCGGGGAFT